MAVSPSAASTQVVSNGGRGGDKQKPTESPQALNYKLLTARLRIVKVLLYCFSRFLFFWHLHRNFCPIPE